MTTTALFVELVVVGVGALLNVALLLATVFTLSVPTQAPEWFDGSLLLAAVFLAAYPLGLLLDRVADLALGWPAGRLRRPYFADVDSFRRARIAVYADTSLRDAFEYARHRIRISRGWALNLAMLLGTYNALVWLRLPDSRPLLRLSVTGTTLLLVLLLASLYSWAKLVQDEARNLSLHPPGHGGTPGP